jgi:hypothetical protein
MQILTLQRAILPYFLDSALSVPPCCSFPIIASMFHASSFLDILLLLSYPGCSAMVFHWNCRCCCLVAVFSIRDILERIRVRILSLISGAYEGRSGSLYFQNVWRALVSCKFLTYTKTCTVLHV